MKRISRFVAALALVAAFTGTFVAQAWGTAATSIAIRANTLVLIEGDSIADGTLAFQAFNGTRNYVLSHYNGGAGANFAAPRFINKATNGAATSTVAARIAAELAANPYTDVWIFLGINDAQTSVALGTSQTNITTIVNAAVAANAKILWVGPGTWGEKYFSGQNPTVDAFIDGGVPGVYGALDGAINTTVAAAGGVFVDIRRFVYAVQEPLLNTAAPGVAVGPLSRPDASGAHFNPGGMYFITAQLTPYISFQ